MTLPDTGKNDSNLRAYLEDLEAGRLDASRGNYAGYARGFNRVSHPEEDIVVESMATRFGGTDDYRIFHIGEKESILEVSASTPVSED